MTNQRGAMFGLDARLALMVFAAMAVIAGFYGASRINTAKDAALIRELEAIDHALQEYQSSMGVFYLFTIEGEPDGRKDFKALWDKKNVKKGYHPYWHGPYINFQSRQHKKFGRYSLGYVQSDKQNLCTTQSDCYVWVVLTDVPADTWEAVNRFYDEGNGTMPEPPGQATTLGRIQADTDGETRTLFFRSIERPHR